MHAGARAYEVVIDGAVVDTVDVCSRVNVGSGFVTDYLVTADADGIDIVFNHVTGGDNPAVKSIEIIDITPAPNTDPTIDSVTPSNTVTIEQGAPLRR